MIILFLFGECFCACNNQHYYVTKITRFCHCFKSAHLKIWAYMVRTFARLGESFCEKAIGTFITIGRNGT